MSAHGFPNASLQGFGVQSPHGFRGGGGRYFSLWCVPSTGFIVTPDDAHAQWRYDTGGTVWAITRDTTGNLYAGGDYAPNAGSLVTPQSNRHAPSYVYKFPYINTITGRNSPTLRISSDATNYGLAVDLAGNIYGGGGMDSDASLVRSWTPTGALRWTSTLAPSAGGSEYVRGLRLSADGSKLFVAVMGLGSNNHAHCLDASTGDVLWHTPTCQQNGAVARHPVSGNPWFLTTEGGQPWEIDANTGAVVMEWARGAGGLGIGFQRQGRSFVVAGPALTPPGIVSQVSAITSVGTYDAVITDGSVSHADSGYMGISCVADYDTSTNDPGIVGSLGTNPKIGDPNSGPPSPGLWMMSMIIFGAINHIFYHDGDMYAVMPSRDTSRTACGGERLRE